jgi:hypothetical protein
LWFSGIGIRVVDMAGSKRRKPSRKSPTSKSKSKSKTPPVDSGARARELSVQKLSAMIEREVQRRLGPNSTFEQRNNMAAELMREGLHRREGDDLGRMTKDDEEVDEEDGRWRRLEQPSSATYFGRWGPHQIEEPLYRKVGVHNGPTMKPIERRAGIIEHMTPDMASVVGALGGCHSSREVVRILWRTGLVPPGRAFVEKRGSRLAEGIAVDAAALEAAARTNETIPAGVVSASCGLDRMSVRVNEQATADSPPPRRKRTKPYKRQAPAPQEAHWRKAWAASMSLYDREGEELRTIMYAAESTTDQNALADRVAADVLAIIAACPEVKVHCVQDAAPELRAMPEALVRALPRDKALVELVDIEHLCRDYLDKVVDACEPDGDPHHMKEWYRGELLRTDRAIDRIWTNLRRLGKRLPVERTAARAAVAAALRYIRHRKNKMRYASHYAANLPIGSGATEGACWQMQGRVKRPGQSWGSVVEPDKPIRTPGLNGVMTTRGLVLSDRWDAAWPTYAAKYRKDLPLAA